ncbi:MAG: DUF2142 domain-containing protein [Lachnospiraceae bacterium]|jgi:uncharacterized membrane protein
MRRKEKRIFIKKLVLVALFAILLGIIGEIIFSGIIYLKGNSDPGKQLLTESFIEQTNMPFENGVYHYQAEGGSTITLTFDEQYINKLQYRYEADGDFLCMISLYGKDVYGQECVKQIQDLNSGVLQRSVVTVQDKIHKIEMHFYPEQKTAIDQVRQGAASIATELTVTDFMLDNSFRFNPFRAVLIMSVAGIFLFLFIFRNEVGTRPEIGVFVGALALGTMWVIALPPMLMGWDEHIHLVKAASLFSGKDSISAAIHYLHTYPEYMGLTLIQSVEEKMDMIRYLNAIDTVDVSIDIYNQSLSSAGYVISALAVFVGRILHFPFYVIFIFGKWVNVVFYSFMAYWAVKYARIGKAVFAAIALYPLIIFSTTLYTYDVAVLGFLMVAVSVILSEMAIPDVKISVKMEIVFFASVILGCLPKATYAPILLLGLFLPKTKFSSKKEMWIFKGVICLLFIGLMSTFVLPTLLAPPSTGDTRGGATNTAGQLALIFSQPLSYLQVWWENVKNTFGTYMLGLPQMVSLGYMGTMKHSYLVGVYLILVMVTDTGYQYEGKKVGLKGVYRVIIAFCITMILGMIWSALYLSFTEVGKLEIAGVQGRYYLPVMGMFLLLFQTDRLRLAWNRKKYYLTVLVVSCMFLLMALWDMCGKYYIL